MFNQELSLKTFLEEQQNLMGEKTIEDCNSNGRESWQPSKLEEYFELNREKHKEVDKLLGGHTKIFQLSIPDSNKNAKLSDCLPYIKTINEIIPSYFDEYGLTRDDLTIGNLVKKKGISTSKHILTYGKMLKLGDEQQKLLNNTVSKLAVVWAANRSKNKRCTLTMTTHPSAFARLGHYPINHQKVEYERSSCFRNNGVNADKKYALGATQNTFILLYNDPSVERDSLIGRSIGFLSDDLSIFNTSNDNNSLLKGDILSLTEQLTKELLSFKETDREETNFDTLKYCFKFDGGLNYCNNYPSSIMKKGETHSLITKVITTRYTKERYPDGEDRYANQGIDE